jgi:YD repeat-containing protein
MPDYTDVRAFTDADGNVRIRNGDVVSFYRLEETTFVSAPNNEAVLTRDGDELQLTANDGSLTRFGSDGKMLFMQDRQGNKLTAAYDAEGRLTSLTDDSGNATQYAYDAFGRLSTYTDPGGRVTTLMYDASGQRVASIASPFGTTSFE